MKKDMAMAVIAWIILSAVIIAACVCSMVFGADVVATWGPSADSNLVSRYELHYGRTNRTTNNPLFFKYGRTNIVGRTNLSSLVTNLSAGIWYFSAIAVTSNNVPSLFSNEAAWTNQDFAPVTLRISGPKDALILQSSVSPTGPWKSLAVITSTNEPLMLTLQPKQSSFRTINTNLPPTPIP